MPSLRKRGAIAQPRGWLRAGASGQVLMLAPILALFLGGCAGTSNAGSQESGKVAALQNELQQLEREASRVADQSAIKRLQRAYGYYLDQKQWDQLADLFADDG